MLNFFGNLIQSPTFITAVTMAATWLWHKARGDQQASIVELARGFARQAVQDAAGSPDWPSKGAAFIEDRVIRGIVDKMGWTSNKLEPFMPLLHPIIEHALADLKDEVQRRLEAAKLQQGLNELAVAAAGVRAAFTPKPIAELVK